VVTTNYDSLVGVEWSKVKERYILLSKVDEGPNFTVVKAQSREGDGVFAIKKIAEVDSSFLRARSVLREVQILKYLSGLSKEGEYTPFEVIKEIILYVHPSQEGIVVFIVSEFCHLSLQKYLDQAEKHDITDEDIVRLHY